MTIVANIQVGNEVELIDQHIAYHLALGIDGFVIADMASVDGTTERLDRYRGDKRFVIRTYDMDSLIDENGPRTAEIGRWMLEATRDHFAPDWVVRMDADEFLYSASTLDSFLSALDAQATLQIERRNAVFEADQTIPPLPCTPAALSAVSVVAQPVKTSGPKYGMDDSLPLILTEVGPKVLARPGQISAYTTGGHAVLDGMGVRQVGPVADGLLLVHFWFTTSERFLRKARFTAYAEELLSRRPQAVRGWQWSRWAGIAQGDAATSEAAILQEYHRQFPDAATLDALRCAGTVRRVADYWTR